jgi:hypothetical protein
MKKKAKKMMQCCGIDKACDGGGMYFLGLIGALIYYISTATGFWNGVLGVLKSLVWPVFLVLEVLKFIGA